MPQGAPTIDDLRRVHELASIQFPHDYLDVGLGAIGLFLHDPPKNAGYQQTPVNSITFAGIGIDGIHFGSITEGHSIDPRSPVVVTIPMAFDDSNYIVGDSLYDFLCLGCRHGYSNIGNLHLKLEETLGYFTSAPADWFDHRAPGILSLLSSELSLAPWRDVHTRFHELQLRWKPSLRVADSKKSNDGNRSSPSLMTSSSGTPADHWQFADPPNAATFTTEFVLAGSPILRVYHDYDGGWQFHGALDQPTTSEVARVVSLQSIVGRDPSVVQLHDLPWGWRAIRDSIEAPWVREKNHPFPTFEENGYHLEDALWMSQYRDDVNPPAEEVRNSLAVGTYAKLIFRFAAEDADRQDGEVERMWVRVVALGDDGNYVGELANDPVHDAELSSGDTIHFHPLHVMEVLAENAD